MKKIVNSKTYKFNCTLYLQFSFFPFLVPTNAKISISSHLRRKIMRNEDFSMQAFHISTIYNNTIHVFCAFKNIHKNSITLKANSLHNIFMNIFFIMKCTAFYFTFYLYGKKRRTGHKTLKIFWNRQPSLNHSTFRFLSMKNIAGI